MSLWRPRAAARQAVPIPGPWAALAQTGYADVDASRWDTSLQSVAVRTAADLIASLGSELPVHVYRGRGSDRIELPVPRWLEDPGGDGYGLADWSYRVLISWLLRGNVYGEALQQGQGGHLMQVELFHPDRVTGWLEDGRPVWQVNGRRVERGFVHRRVNPIPGQILGASPIAYHASTIGVSLAAVQFGAQWFRDGAHPSSILESTERDVTPGLAKTVKERFVAAIRGTREPVVLDRGWKYQQVQVNPDESQFLETMGYSEAQCARIFGPGIAEVLGYSTKGVSLTYSNIADRDLHLLKYSLGRWLRRLERLLSEFLPRPQYVRLDRDALLETNTLQRYAAHGSALTNRWKTVNEVRRDEDLEPVPWGDEPNGAAAPMPQDEPPPEDDDAVADDDDEE